MKWLRWILFGSHVDINYSYSADVLLLPQEEKDNKYLQENAS